MFNRAKDEFAADKYSALRSIAAKAGDHLSELQFFSSEMRARRFWHDRPFGKGAGRFWFGLIYELTSDFGRSLWRPIFMWFIFFVIGVYISVLASPVANESGPLGVVQSKCVDGKGSLLAEAVYLSMANAMLFGFSDEDRVNVTKECLFGIPNISGNRSSNPNFPVGVAIYQIFHGLLSALSVFLIGLATRNNFRAR